MGWLFNLVYFLLLILASPWLLYAAIRHGKYRDGLATRLLGRVPHRDGSRRCVWMHAVSVGEVNLLEPLIRGFELEHPEWECVISATTRTGYEVARQKYAPRMVFYCPLDFTWAVHSALQALRPDLLLLAELELWPNLIRRARQRGAKIAVVNGRLSEKSCRGYQRLAWVIRPLLQQIDLVAVQNEQYAARFRQLGAPPSRVHVTGSLKFDGACTQRDNSATRELAALAGIREQDQVWLAGSTQHPEEQLALASFQELREEFPRLRLILVPRHPERFDDVAVLLERAQLPWRRRSSLAAGEQGEQSDPASVLLVDAMGELAAWWGTAQIAYVGGSMGSREGQNMIEPAAYGAAVSFGPRTRNFRDVVELLLQQDAATVVQDGAELTRFVRHCLQHPREAAELGERARQLVEQQLGACERTLQLLEPLLELPAVRQQT